MKTGFYILLTIIYGLLFLFFAYMLVALIAGAL